MSKAYQGPAFSTQSVLRLNDGATEAILVIKAAYYPIREILEAERNGRPCLEPRPLSQSYLEKVLATSKKTQGEYSGLNSQSSVWRGSREPDEVQAAISGISKLLVSQIINLQSFVRNLITVVTSVNYY